jgi:hypothetical protein
VLAARPAKAGNTVKNKALTDSPGDTEPGARIAKAAEMHHFGRRSAKIAQIY